MPQAQARRARADSDHIQAARRTVVIRGRPGLVEVAPRSPRLVQGQRQRAPRTVSRRLAGRPDRVALLAVLMALFLVFVAAASSRGATFAAHAPRAGQAPAHAPALVVKSAGGSARAFVEGG